MIYMKERSFVNMWKMLSGFIVSMVDFIFARNNFLVLKWKEGSVFLWHNIWCYNISGSRRNTRRISHSNFEAIHVTHNQIWIIHFNKFTYFYFLKTGVHDLFEGHTTLILLHTLYISLYCKIQTIMQHHCILSVDLKYHITWPLLHINILCIQYNNNVITKRQCMRQYGNGGRDHYQN